MAMNRRDILKSLTAGLVSGSVLRVIPAEAAEYTHHAVHAQKVGAPAGVYKPKYFSGGASVRDLRSVPNHHPGG